jgi:hypothetical protein
MLSQEGNKEGNGEIGDSGADEKALAAQPPIYAFFG